MRQEAQHTDTRLILKICSILLSLRDITWSLIYAHFFSNFIHWAIKTTYGASSRTNIHSQVHAKVNNFALRHSQLENTFPAPFRIKRGIG